MKSIQSTTNRERKKVLIASIVAVAILVGGSAYAFVSLTGREDVPAKEDLRTDSSNASVEEAPSTLSDSDAAQKEKFINDNQESQYLGQQKSNISATMQANQQNSEVVVQTKVTGATDGQCYLVASANGRIVEKSAPIIFQSEYSSCAGFSIATSELGSGTWKLTLTIKSDGDSDQITNKVNIQ